MACWLPTATMIVPRPMVLEMTGCGMSLPSDHSPTIVAPVCARIAASAIVFPASGLAACTHGSATWRWSPSWRTPERRGLILTLARAAIAAAST
ncbi:MAG: hypothetical protein A2V63_00535 [Candidatus Eisenbacteria bacterium RBG_19FT_COMBO_70_11]|nr:MAG: hypothetical protein A2V63_00535 [Candidatus Eisenbacteria bacterium RBG_19FT_COMBO_70_11]